ncbi:UDP-2,4-diacetamido-2,4,6-trideoxy-beta-L-altropyranose hydrolase [Shewanella sp. FJAT-51649]|uniref:UDP-2,4-diacetamido-2,4, 6-trideoxy-beta-L-altropyranose hydrolase n=1 Tax=unclassified Shewanella TaxID=196818 RepID=UPI000B497368|nr:MULTISPECIES: UDP-2,4-diacetamido-2,4,6-trideoxy-beta-L-altropyranose hydrolase [unclassified Shewanella]QYJ72726.1 UDP-2,4-diacetamido-2,4,6-trideoxy-beta-L-altropyranose hydrolase [Shewanella sp. FJAT-51649]
MNILIRADASVLIGSGHIMRCLVLAQALMKQGHEVSFACRRQPGDLVELIQKRGFRVMALIAPGQAPSLGSTLDYSSWLGVPWQQDAESLVTQAGKIELLIVDHYGINIEWERWVKGALGCKLFVIDDLVRSHAADLLLDQTLLREKQAYVSLGVAKRVLVGSDYALLAEHFPAAREAMLSKPATLNRPRVLLFMGAMDLPNVTLRVIEAFALSGADKRPLLTVLLGKHARHYQQVREACIRAGGWVNHIEHVDNMAELMCQHDLAIGAAGTTALERACVGLPSIIIPLADNQKDICQNLVATNAVISLEIDKIEAELIVKYELLLADYRDFRNRNFALCDGLGTRRVMLELNHLLNDTSSSLTLRKATVADIKQVYGWQIHPSTRQYANNPQSPGWQEHQTWMRKQLANPEHFFYFIVNCESHSDLGVVRLDRVARAEYVISIFIDPSQYGKKIAGKALALIDTLHGDVTIIAKVLKENVVSQRLFSSANYRQVSDDTFIREPLK